MKEGKRETSGVFLASVYHAVFRIRLKNRTRVSEPRLENPKASVKAHQSHVGHDGHVGVRVGLRHLGWEWRSEVSAAAASARRGRRTDVVRCGMVCWVASDTDLVVVLVDSDVVDPHHGREDDIGEVDGSETLPGEISRQSHGVQIFRVAGRTGDILPEVDGRVKSS